MEFLSLVGTLSQLIGGGLGVWIGTEVVKSLPFIPINEGQKTALRATAAALSAVAVGLLGFTNDNLKPTDIQSIIQALLGVAVAWGTAHGAHKVLSK